MPMVDGRPTAGCERRIRRLCLGLACLLGSATAPAQTAPPVEAPSSSPRDFIQVNNRLYFTADDGIHGRELWVYDEADGCRLAMDFISGPESGDPVCRAVWGDYLYIAAVNDQGGRDLWQWNDHTRQALRLYANPHRESHAEPHVHMRTSDNPALFFTLCDESLAWNIYTQNAGEGELRRVTDFPPGTSIAYASPGIVLPDGVDVFLAHGYLWRSDGTAEGTVRLRLSGLSRTTGTWLQPLGDRAIFKLSDQAHGLELWVTDGTEAGTRLLGDIWPGPGDSAVGQSGRLNDVLFFGANDSMTGLELWCTDGTPEGTRPVKDINLGRGSSDPHYFQAAENLLFFGADDGQHGVELWCTDGTTEGTRLVKDIDPGPASSSPYHFAAVGHLACFGATTPIHGDALWVSDGTTSGTRLLADVVPGNTPGGPAHLTALNGKLVLAYTEPLHGEELWMANVVSGDIRLLADINAPILNPSTDPDLLTAHGNVVYFVAHDLAHGKELWSSQGTETSTRLVKDINPGERDSSPEQLTEGADLVFFTAMTNETGRELWRTDGTAQGTLQLADLAPGPNDGLIQNLTPVARGLYFTSGPANVACSIWYTDGTSTHTYQIRGFGGTETRLQCPRLFAHWGQAYAYVEDDAGVALYRLEQDQAPSGPLIEVPRGTAWPTPRGPREVEVPLPRLLCWMYPPVASHGNDPVAFDGEYYFVLHTANYGAELWRTNTLTSGVDLVCDAYPGVASSSPRQLTALKGRLYFIADHPSFGQVLWATTGSARDTEVVRPVRADSTLPPVPAITLAPLGDFLIMTGRDAAVSVDYTVPPGLYVLYVRTNETGFEALTLPPDFQVSHLTSVADLVFFAADDGKHGNELWALNGALTCSLVKDILVPGNLKPLRK